MPTLSVRCRRHQGVTLVEILVRSERRCRIRIAPTTEVRIWPPRTGGEPEAGWTEEGFAGVVDAGVTALGFATPDDVSESEVELVEGEPLSATERPEGVDAWFRQVEDRLRRAERIAAADSVAEATEAVATIGGLAAVEELAAAVDRDRRLLDRLDTVPGTLQRRIDEVELELETLEKLA